MIFFLALYILIFFCEFIFIIFFLSISLHWNNDDVEIFFFSFYKVMCKLVDLILKSYPIDKIQMKMVACIFHPLAYFNFFVDKHSTLLCNFLPILNKSLYILILTFQMCFYVGLNRFKPHYFITFCTGNHQKSTLANPSAKIFEIMFCFPFYTLCKATHKLIKSRAIQCLHILKRWNVFNIKYNSHWLGLAYQQL